MLRNFIICACVHTCKCTYMSAEACTYPIWSQNNKPDAAITYLSFENNTSVHFQQSRLNTHRLQPHSQANTMFWFALTIIHGSRRTEKAGIIQHANDLWGPQLVDFLVRLSSSIWLGLNTPPLFQTLDAQDYSVSKPNCSWTPTPKRSMSTYIIHATNVSRPSTFFPRRPGRSGCLW